MKDTNKFSTRVYLVGIFLALIADVLSSLFKIKSDTLWDIIDEVGRHFNIEEVNTIVLSNSHYLNRRIDRDVTKAIDDAKIEMDYKDPEIESEYTETVDGETALGGGMRIQTKTTPEKN
jgi:hypothetical protein